MTDPDQKTTGQGPEQTSDDPSVRHVWIIPVNVGYIKSLQGIMEIGIAVLSLIAWMCTAPALPAYCINTYGGTYSFFKFCAGTTFLTLTLWFVMFVIMINQRLKVVPWRLGELIILGGFGVLYIIAAIMVAASACGQDSLRAAAAFGFFTVFAMAGHFYYSFRLWRETELPAAESDTKGISTVTDR